MSLRKEKYVENHGIMNMGKDYHVYHMKWSDYLIACVIGFAAAAVVIHAFFNTLIFSVVCGILCAAFAPKIMNAYRKEKTLYNLREQFKDLMDSLSGSYSAGKNTMKSFGDAGDDLKQIYGEKADIVNEVKIINTGLENGLTIEVMLLDFAERCGLEDVKSFADVFDACNREGGNIKEIVVMTRDVISEKIDVEIEIETIISGSKNELYIMMAMPVVIILILNGLGSGTANENTLSNIVIKLVCIAIFAVAFLIGKKITDIKV